MKDEKMPSIGVIIAKAKKGGDDDYMKEYEDKGMMGEMSGSMMQVYDKDLPELKDKEEGDMCYLKVAGTIDKKEGGMTYIKIDNIEVDDDSSQEDEEEEIEIEKE